MVEGFALRVAAGEVPDALKNIRLLSLDLGLLQAGAGVKGEFENRLKSVIAEVKASPTPIVMFIDEAHTLIGAGGAEGQGDAANLLKPALARGEMRTIAATTWAEYKKYFEKDAALARRFQVVKVEEPDEAAAILMVRGLVATLEGHHKVRILDEAVDAAVRLSHRYIFGRQLPDKAIALLDTACARVGMSQAAVPAAVEAAGRRLGGTRRRGRHPRPRGRRRHGSRRAQGGDRRGARRGRGEPRGPCPALGGGEGARRRDRRGSHGGGAPGRQRAGRWCAEAVPDPAALDRLRGLRGRNCAAAGRDPAGARRASTRQAVADVVAAWTGIPVGRMVADEIARVLDFEAIMGARIRRPAAGAGGLAQRDARRPRAG